MLDRYWHGDASRISPEAPVPVVKVGDVEDRAGGAANVAMNITALGGNVRLLGLVGNDEPGKILEKKVKDQHIESEFVVMQGSHTITKLRVMSHHQQLIRLDFEDEFTRSEGQQAVAEFTKNIESCEAVVLSDYAKGTLRNIPQLIEIARSHNKKIIIDPKGTDFSIYKGATLITPNQSEFEAVVGPCVTEQVLLEKGQSLCNQLDLDGLLVTRSEKGMVLFQRDEPPFLQPTKAKDVFDVTGAGDTVIATLATALAAGKNVVEATQIANLAAGVVVAKVGTATATVQDLQMAMLEHTPLKRGVVEEQELESLIIQAKAAGERVVMTNGCFDILHAGHVAYLSRAAELGDRLIIAVNDNDSVKRLKGSERPVNDLLQRMAVLNGLESVDWVVPFSEDTPARLIEFCLPDVLVKGGDYKIEDIAGGDAVIRSGGEVKVLDFLDGCSSTSIIESIKKRL